MEIIARFQENSLRMKRVCLLLMALLLVSCSANISVKPEVPFSDNQIVVRGDVAYEGNSSYLPATVQHQNGSEVTIKYAYVVSYDGTGLGTEMLTGFLPTTLVGTPTGGDSVTVAGKLEIFKNGQLFRTYVAEARVLKPRSLFLGGVDKTELRRLALISLKENIEQQMRNDFSSLSQI